MGISVQGKSFGEVTQHTADRFDVHTVLAYDGCEGAAEVMEPGMPDLSRTGLPYRYLSAAVRIGAYGHLFLAQT